MKIDRLLSIVIYLLNHETVSARALAEKFEVSKRTILRDVEQISLAGIPIQSTQGINGGYSIMPGYKLERQFASGGDYSSIVTALSGMCSAYDDRRFGAALEKILSLMPKPPEQHIFFDFGAAKENAEIQTRLKMIEAAIVERRGVEISYLNAYGAASRRAVEPLALTYKWYAWYLLAYCEEKKDYRVFKVARIAEIILLQSHFAARENVAELLENAFRQDGMRYREVTLLCKAEIKTQAQEYLSGNVTEILENGDFILKFCPIESERVWFAMLLSFGDCVKVLEPEELKTRLTDTAKKILSLY